ncbi:regulator of chromosome condensation 1/beta-lactamase-inhibitor protein II [Cantharellus anzutake]|uniref:regulator of chromosome condensation 1/beta-lactamase-inhibitor protein II n=1 Tax=Cantharellus anzutake TaxID=1750568 RepID=UPI0019063A9F|nr:regulator of chromosome condensation 1/beta-lactamase-inhibitor protein II [Cantharellus anzutake]KAF8334027.1 regulator of chromosome condensation 1/beta-lactamase-inhibitor protein II [Cantharellus anzutake]
MHLSISPSNIFALSRSGRIFSLPSDGSVPVAQTSTYWILNWSPSPYQLTSDAKLHSGEKFTSISAGNNHLLAVTSAGRTFTHPITLNANSHGQLGTRKIHVETVGGSSPREQVELIPKLQEDPFSNDTPFARPKSPDTPVGPEKRPSRLLYEIPSLRGINVAQAVAGGRSSYVRTKDGRVLSWGANEYGQLGLGALVTLPCVFVPTEISLARTYSSGTSIKCTDLAAGGDAAYFTVESSSLQLPVPAVDVFACGMGQWGALGNGSFSQAQSTPVKVKVISGNAMHNETEGRTQAIRPITITASPTGGHTLTLLSGAHDVLAWGANGSYQLGNGKRSNLPQPTYMRDFMVTYNPTSDPNEAAAEYGLIPERMSLRVCIVKQLLDMKGTSHGRNVKVQEWPVAGGKASLIYWRIANP